MNAEEHVVESNPEIVIAGKFANLRQMRMRKTERDAMNAHGARNAIFIAIDWTIISDKGRYYHCNYSHPLPLYLSIGMIWKLQTCTTLPSTQIKSSWSHFKPCALGSFKAKADIKEPLRENEFHPDIFDSRFSLLTQFSLLQRRIKIVNEREVATSTSEFARSVACFA